MSPRTAARPARRSHAERTAETRGRVLAAVVESIAEVGYQRTTATEIAKRAGVTWGAVQHHFGDKEGILAAVLEDSFARFAELLRQPPGPDDDIEKRASQFIDRAWEHFSSPHYRSTFEILLNLPEDLEPSWQSGMFRAWNGIWADYFPASQLTRRQTIDLMHYAISVLSGLAAMKMLEGPSARIRASELGFLKETLRRELSRTA